MKLRAKKMTAKTPNPQADRLTGEADEDLSRDSSIVLKSAIDGNQCHKEICESLIPYTTGWENLFVREMAKITKTGAIQWEKLKKIAQKCEQEKENSRLCHHCGRKAQIIDQFSYYCRQCGNCLNYFWHEGGAK